MAGSTEKIEESTVNAAKQSNGLSSGVRLKCSLPSARSRTIQASKLRSKPKCAAKIECGTASAKSSNPASNILFAQIATGRCGVTAANPSQTKRQSFAKPRPLADECSLWAAAG